MTSSSENWFDFYRSPSLFNSVPKCYQLCTAAWQTHGGHKLKESGNFHALACNFPARNTLLNDVLQPRTNLTLLARVEGEE